MTMKKPRVVLGGPGCGKTTYLLGVVEEALESGVHPIAIGYVAFTRKAAMEARDRMAEKFNILREDIPFFCTLHSLAFKQMGVNPDQVLDDKRFARFAKIEGFDLSAGHNSEDGPPMLTDDDKALSAVHYARLMRKPLRDVAQDMDACPDRAERMAQEIKLFKRDQGVVDYTDMIEQFVQFGTCPRFELLIVDEAQDLSRLQWEMVEKLAEGVPNVYFAGDDDQAIYEWAGADLNYFLNIDGERIVLKKSYRLRKSVFDLCQHIVSAVHPRYPKEQQYLEEGGKVEYFQDLRDLPLHEGEWMLLARNEYLLWPWRGYLWDLGIPFFSRVDGEYKASTDRDEVKAVLAWEHLRKGGMLQGGAVTKLYGYLGTKVEKAFRGAEFVDAENYNMEELQRAFGLRTDASWLEALTLPPSVRHHIRMARERGESLVNRPRITVSTIHGVKGGEAENVVLKLDVAKSSVLSYHNNPSTESRVFFVAASRAKRNLYLMDPQSSFYYDVNGAIS